MNRRKSHNTAFKLRAIAFANEINPETGVQNDTGAAARHFNVSDGMIRKWRREQEILKTMNGTKRRRRPRIPKFPELEQRLRRWILDERGKKRKVSFFAVLR